MKHSIPYFYFSFRSPYSWVGVRRLQEELGADFQRLVLIPFWEPDTWTLELLSARGGETPYVPMSRAKHLYILQDIKRLTTRLGYPMQWPVDVEPWWDLPHLAYLKARELGKGEALFNAIHAARWERGEDICKVEVIEALANRAGLNGTVIRGAPDDPQIRTAGVDALYKAYQNGVFGVPFFTIGREKFWGVDRVDQFVARWRETVDQEGGR